MKRIECEHDGCTQLLQPEEYRCNRCGQPQTTGKWLLVLLACYYPLVTLVVGFVVLIVGGLLVTAALGTLDPLVFLAPLPVIYLFLAGRAVYRYYDRRRRIADAQDLAGYTAEG